MSTSAEQIRSYSGPTILSFGFRPLFLLAGLWSAFAMAMWTLMLTGNIALPTAFDMLSWHVHEFLYGYLPAVVAGFLLTAVPNWTGRLPVTGTPLLVLVLTWLAGRIAILFSSQLGMAITTIVDLSFLATLTFVVGREIVAGRNWRNLKVLIVVMLLSVGNLVFDVEAAVMGSASGGIGARIGIAGAVFLIMLVGGRIVPSFTRNWLARRASGRLPTSFNRFDQVTMAIAGITLILWVGAPDRPETALLCIIAGLSQTWRLARWAGERTISEPLVLILHVGYSFIPLGFFAVGGTAFLPQIPSGAALHAWTAGAIGVMTLAVMTRATLGHSGRPLQASRGTVFIYSCIVGAAVLRMAAGIGIGYEFFLYVAATAWIAAFAGFTILYGPLLLRARR